MAITIEDTPAQALRFLLDSRLQFGNAQQIEALTLLRLAEELLDLPPHECEECEGEGSSEGPGHCDCCGRECAYCTGDEECGECEGTGSVAYSRDHIYRFTGVQIWKLIEKHGLHLAA